MATVLIDHGDEIGGVVESIGGDGVVLLEDKQAIGVYTIQDLSQFKQIGFILAWKYTNQEVRNCCSVTILPLNIFKQDYNLQVDIYDGTTRRFASVKYVSDTQVNIDTVTQISGNWNLYLIGIK